jgi:ubiquinone biosynthesis monooxygenase Coq7
MLSYPHLTARMPAHLRAEFRSSHAGEMGAVWIYWGILLASTDPVVRKFAREHLQTEQQHLALFEELIHLYRGSMLLPIWVLAGFLTGFLPAFFGRTAVFGTIEAVETFVSAHYRQQIEMVKAEPAWAPLAKMLEHCLEDEIEHCHEAANQLRGHSRLLRLWAKIVATGSQFAVKVSKII